MYNTETSAMHFKISGLNESGNYHGCHDAWLTRDQLLYGAVPKASDAIYQLETQRKDAANDLHHINSIHAG